MSSCLLRTGATEKNYSYFIQYAHNVTSQGGEDGIIKKIFELLDDGTDQRVCVDIGAWDGKYLSNSYMLCHEANWSGVLIEANLSRVDDLSRLYFERSDVKCIGRHVNVQPIKNNSESECKDSINHILHEYNVNTDFDFVSVDIDGADYHVWNNLCNKSQSIFFRPKVVCIEFNPTIPNNIVFIQECDTRVHQGNSLLALTELGELLDYVLVVTTTFNGIYVRKDLYEQFILPVLIENDSVVLKETDMVMRLQLLHPPASMYSYLFQTYDGELKFAGSKKLIWHKIAMNAQKLQILPMKQRKFPYEPPWDAEVQNLKLRMKEFSVAWGELYSHCSINADDVELQLEIDFLSSVFNEMVDMATALLPIPTLRESIVNILCSSIIQMNEKLTNILDSYNNRPCVDGNGKCADMEHCETLCMGGYLLVVPRQLLPLVRVWYFVLHRSCCLFLRRANSYYEYKYRDPFGNIPVLSPNDSTECNSNTETTERVNVKYHKEDVHMSIYWYKLVFQLLYPLAALASDMQNISSGSSVNKYDWFLEVSDIVSFQSFHESISRLHECYVLLSDSGHSDYIQNQLEAQVYSSMLKQRKIYMNSGN